MARPMEGTGAGGGVAGLPRSVGSLYSGGGPVERRATSLSAHKKPASPPRLSGFAKTAISIGLTMTVALVMSAGASMLLRQLAVRDATEAKEILVQQGREMETFEVLGPHPSSKSPIEESVERLEHVRAEMTKSSKNIARAKYRIKQRAKKRGIAVGVVVVVGLVVATLLSLSIAAFANPPVSESPFPILPDGSYVPVITVESDGSVLYTTHFEDGSRIVDKYTDAGEFVNSTHVSADNTVTNYTELNVHMTEHQQSNGNFERTYTIIGGDGKPAETIVVQYSVDNQGVPSLIQQSVTTLTGTQVMFVKNGKIQITSTDSAGTETVKCFESKDVIATHHADIKNLENTHLFQPTDPTGGTAGNCP
eukprot:GHVT01100574.1.p1 GENE.GHVT01100574.1~~GHVT01100574.1.p1  ORF type:complete len:365 (+),score=57.86 GHVT01100574.1:257-1351(+)